MSDTELFIAIGIVAIAVLAIYAFAWRATSTASTLVKLLVRVGAPVVVFVAAGFAILSLTLQHAKVAAPPSDTKRFEYRPEKPKPRARKKATRATEEQAAKAARGKAEQQRRDGDRRRQQAEAEEAARKRAKEAKTEAAVRKGIGGSSAPQPTSPAPVGTEGGAAPGTGTEITGMAVEDDSIAEEVAEVEESEPAAIEAPISGASAPPPLPPPVVTTTAPPSEAAKKDNSDWDLVPVFYGTDRQRADHAERLKYDGSRGRRLELGHAMVSVPKSHQVPNIERPWAVRIPYFNVTIYEEAEDPKKHFVMQEIKALSRTDFLNLVRQRLAKSKTFQDQAFVFVHGFNTSFENGVYRTAQIAYDLKFDGAPFLYSWPSGGGVASYTYDRESSGQSTPYMRDFMKLVINETGAKAVSVIAHSMGNQPILHVLRDLKQSTPEGVIISQVILAAPDVDRDNFENIAKDILGLAKGVTLYVAANDQALQFSRRFHGGVPRAGDVPAQGPVVINGIDTIDVTAASTDSLGINHSGYAENNALLKDIERLIATGAPPSDRHPPKFERIGQGQRAYWKYPPQN